MHDDIDKKPETAKQENPGKTKTDVRGSPETKETSPETKSLYGDYETIETMKTMKTNIVISGICNDDGARLKKENSAGLASLQNPTYPPGETNTETSAQKSSKNSNWGDAGDIPEWASSLDKVGESFVQDDGKGRYVDDVPFVKSYKRILLTAKKETGKTSMLMILVVKFLLRDEKNFVIYLTEEEDLLDRFRVVAGAHIDKVIKRLVLVSTADIVARGKKDKSDFEAINRKIVYLQRKVFKHKENGGRGILVSDTLTSLVSCIRPKININLSDDVTELFTRTWRSWVSWCKKQEMDVAQITVHHFTKGSKENPSTPRGSGALEDQHNVRVEAMRKDDVITFAYSGQGVKRGSIGMRLLDERRVPGDEDSCVLCDWELTKASPVSQEEEQHEKEKEIDLRLYAATVLYFHEKNVECSTTAMKEILGIGFNTLKWSRERLRQDWLHGYKLKPINEHIAEPADLIDTFCKDSGLAPVDAKIEDGKLVITPRAR